MTKLLLAEITLDLEYFEKIWACQFLLYLFIYVYGSLLHTINKKSEKC